MHKKLMVILIALLALSLLGGCPKKATPTGMQQTGPSTRPETGTMAKEPGLFGEIRDDHKKFTNMLTDLETVRDQKSATKKLNEFREAVVPHLRAEEAAFYPAVASTMGQEMIKTLTSEHQAASQMLKQLQGMTVTDPAFVKKVTALRLAIEKHVAREEGQIFLTAERVMATREWDQVKDQFDKMKKSTLDALKKGGAVGESRTTTGDTLTPETTERERGTAAPSTSGY